jgi:signal peptidase I
MAKKAQKEVKTGPGLASVMGISGMALAVLGVLTVMASNRMRPGGVEWLWWAGILVAVAGGHLIFFNGMPRAQILEWIKSEAFALILAMLIRWPIAEPYRIPSGSMEPTLHGDERIGRGDRVFVNKWIYGVRWPFMNKRLWQGSPPQRWDIMVFKTVEENALHGTLVKRIVGMPGERIHIQDGKIYANGQPLETPKSMPEVYYTSPPPGFSNMMYGVRTEDEYAVVPEGHYLVLGDNSASSRDGRFFGWLPNENIVGRVACIWWPPQRWRDFTGFSETLWWRALVAALSVAFFVRILIGRSCAMPIPGKKRPMHYFISFLSLGLRIPFTERWLVRWARPRRGQVVMYAPESEHAPQGALLCGRVAGLPGEKVSIVDGRLLVDGKPLADSGVLSQPQFASKHADAVFGRSKGKEYASVPEGHYFLVLDHPPEPEEEVWDSRSLGWIAEKQIMGKATAVWWPPSRWGRVK